MIWDYPVLLRVAMPMIESSFQNLQVYDAEHEPLDFCRTDTARNRHCGIGARILQVGAAYSE